MLAAAIIVVLANGLALLHAGRNRAGQPDAEVVLTQHELRLVHHADNSGVTLFLNFAFIDPDPRGAETWLDPAKLSSLGFNCGVDASDKAADFYNRQVPRTAFVALELDGPASRLWHERHPEIPGASRLIPIDAAPDPVQLRTRHPDRHSVIILPAVIRISLLNAFPARGRKARVIGSIDKVPTAIHVPQPFSARLRTLSTATRPAYSVSVTFGSLLDPWVTGVELEATGSGRLSQ